MDTELVDDFVSNYDPKDGSGVVKERIVDIEAQVWHEALYLLIFELSVGMEASEDFKPKLHFKMGVGAFTKEQG